MSERIESDKELTDEELGMVAGGTGEPTFQCAKCGARILTGNGTLCQKCRQSMAKEQLENMKEADDLKRQSRGFNIPGTNERPTAYVGSSGVD